MMALKERGRADNVVHAFAFNDQWMTGFVDRDNDHAYPVTRLNFSYMNRMNINI
jgi:hypothetical protein